MTKPLPLPKPKKPPLCVKEKKEKSLVCECELTQLRVVHSSVTYQKISTNAFLDQKTEGESKKSHFHLVEFAFSWERTLSSLIYRFLHFLRWMHHLEKLKSQNKKWRSIKLPNNEKDRKTNEGWTLRCRCFVSFWMGCHFEMLFLERLFKKTWNFFNLSTIFQNWELLLGVNLFQFFLSHIPSISLLCDCVCICFILISYLWRCPLVPKIW